MKIIQSYWTMPSLKYGSLDINDRNLGGWLDKKYYYYSSVLSCLTLRKFYKELELYTDKLGENILIKQLKLPYTKVNTVLDKLNLYNPSLWALGKVYTYSLQKEPFLHVDGDVFIQKKFEDRLMSSKIIAQNLERNFKVYLDTFLEVRSNFQYIPEILEDYFKTNSAFNSINAGIFGGNDGQTGMG